jgi:hypothetical protein
VESGENRQVGDDVEVVLTLWGLVCWGRSLALPGDMAGNFWDDVEVVLTSFELNSNRVGRGDCPGGEQILGAFAGRMSNHEDRNAGSPKNQTDDL